MIERFVEEYAEQAFKVAFHLSADVEQAKELVQEAFVKLIRSWEHYDSEQPLENYFLTILRNLYFDGRKSFERRHVVSLDVPAGESEDSMSYAEALPDEAEMTILERLERQEDSQLVRDALKDLNRRHRALITLCDIQGLTYEQAAEAIDCPLNTVRSRLFRARAALKKALLARRGQEVIEP